MKCNICNSNWILGNESPVTKACPICGTSFEIHPETRCFSDIYELIQVLFLEKDEEFFSNPEAFHAYLNDLFPTEEDLRELVRIILNYENISQIFGLVNSKKSYEELKVVLDQIVQQPYDDFKSFIMYICGYPKNRGTIFDEKYFLDYANKSDIEQYKLVALNKANLINEDENTIVKIIESKRSLNDETWNDDIKKLINTNDSSMMFHLYEIYKSDKQFDDAIECLTKAANMNNRHAQYCLGKEYITGKIIPSNIEKGYQLINEAADNGVSEAQYIMYNYYFHKNDMESSRKYLGMAVSLMNKQALYEYAIHLLEGDLVSENVNKCIKVLEECANLGHIDAMRKLVYIFSTGYKVKKDFIKADIWRSKLNGIT